MADPGKRVGEVKARVEALKTKVEEAQARVAEASALARGSYPRRDSLWRDFERRKREWTAVVTELRKAKAELASLSGTNGSDPKWKLICEAWHVLSALDEAGVDIGERGHALIDDIEFHVPHSKLFDVVKEGEGTR